MGDCDWRIEYECAWRANGRIKPNGTEWNSNAKFWRNQRDRLKPSLTSESLPIEPVLKKLVWHE